MVRRTFSMCLSRIIIHLFPKHRYGEKQDGDMFQLDAAKELDGSAGWIVGFCGREDSSRDGALCELGIVSHQRLPANVRGVPAQRILIMSLLCQSKLTRLSLVSTTNTARKPLENQRPNPNYDENLTRASRSNTGTCELLGRV